MVGNYLLPSARNMSINDCDNDGKLVTSENRYNEVLLQLILLFLEENCVLLQHETSGLFEVALGGAIYIAGVAFFKCDGIVPFAHAIWHCFVSVAAVFHYVAVCKYLLTGPNDSNSLEVLLSS
jgi:hypothetical protein